MPDSRHGYLRGRSAIVTGASRGIGKAIAVALAENGADVMLSGRRESSLEPICSELSERSLGRVRSCPCDVTDPEQVAHLVAHAAQQFGGIDLLVNNAGVVVLKPIDQLTPAEWRHVIDTNLNGAFYCSREVIPHLRHRGGGDIVNIASRSSVNPFAGGSAYNASKYGLLGLGEAMLLDLKQDGIRVINILPGRVATDFADEPPQPWHLAAEDVAQVMLDQLALPRRAVVSRVELRPAQSPR